jgi:hypothetical protein
MTIFFVATALLLAFFETRTISVFAFTFLSDSFLPAAHRGASSSSRATTRRRMLRIFALINRKSYDMEITESTSSSVHVACSIDCSRRAVMHKSLATLVSTTLLTCTETNISPAMAASSRSSIKPDDAYQGLLKARQELVTAAKCIYQTEIMSACGPF